VSAFYSKRILTNQVHIISIFACNISYDSISKWLGSWFYLADVKPKNPVVSSAVDVAGVLSLVISLIIMLRDAECFTKI
jgi:hypothetical protein